jgi:uncharacterized protein YcfJ
MNKLQKTLIGTVLGGALLTLTPLAMADRYVNNHYYGGHAPVYQKQHPVYQTHPKYQQPRHKTVVHHHYHHQVPQERVVVVQPPRHHAPARHYGHAPSYGHAASGHYQSHTPMILGGIIGGVIGSEMGKGRGKDASTLAGVILGGSIGRDMGR